MPIYQVQAPDGRIIEIEAPQGATEQQIMRFVQQQYNAIRQEKPKTPAPIDSNATAEVVGSIASSMIAEPIAGLAGIVQSVNPFAEEGAGARAVEATREALTYRPKTAGGQRALQAVGEFMQPVGEAIQKAETTLGEKTLEATGSPLLATAAHSLPTAAMEAVGLAGLSKAKKAIPAVESKALKTIDDVFQYQTPAKRAIAEQLKQGSTDADVAKYILQDGKAKVDPLATKAIDQGFDEGVIAPLKQASKTDKLKMLKMTEMMEKAKKNRLYAMENRPSDIAGQSLMDRVNFVIEKNRDAGQKLDAVAKTLKGQSVDFGDAVTDFIRSLNDEGVQLVKRNGKIVPDFAGSTFEGVSGPSKVIRNLINRMSDTKAPDAYDVHRLKKYIDENVTYGKGGEGLKGKAESILKNLRRKLDSALDESFSDYNRVNQQYSDTINALDSLQKGVGPSINFASDTAENAAGTVLRKLMSNYSTRGNLMDGITDIENIAKKYGAAFNDDIKMQVLFVDELDRIFKPVQRTGFQSQITQAIDAAENAKDITATGLAAEAARKAINAAKRVNDENRFKAIRNLLREGAKQ